MLCERKRVSLSYFIAYLLMRIFPINNLYLSNVNRQMSNRESVGNVHHHGEPDVGSGMYGVWYWTEVLRLTSFPSSSLTGSTSSILQFTILKSFIMENGDTKFIKYKDIGAFETIESKLLCIEYGHGQFSWLYIFLVPLADFHCNIFYVKMFYKRRIDITL